MMEMARVTKDRNNAAIGSEFYEDTLEPILLFEDLKMHCTKTGL